MIHTLPKSEYEKATDKRNLSGCLITALDPTDGASEAYRKLRTNLFYALVDRPPKLVMVTSPGPGEGKSAVCANLGVVLAQAGKNTLILDCDLRKPMMHEIFALTDNGGLVDILVGEISLQDACQEPLPDSRLKVLPAGTRSPNPAELLDSRRLSEFFTTLRVEFDYVLVDSSPIGMVTDPIILATQVDGVLLTLDARKTRRGDVQRAIRGLTTVGANVLGTVINRMTGSKNDYSQSVIPSRSGE